MSNSFFQFKQFTVNQSEATLKVCTESCIFGASIPVGHAQHILDIGTGTGLLALMLAQRSEAKIEAIELDLPSARDAQKNFSQSPWENRLTLHQGDIKLFLSEVKFDLIVCNPPFFIHQLKSSNARTNAALHGSELQPDDLSHIVDRLLTEEGRFFVLLPEKEMHSLTQQMEQAGWKKFYRLNIYQQEQKNIFRTIAGFSRDQSIDAREEQSLVIYKNGRVYTDDFIQLLKGYYLYL